MSKERELLERAMSLIDYRYAPSEAIAVHREIQELLAQPEHIVDVTDKVEPVEDRIARWHKLGYEQGKRASKREPLSDEEVGELLMGGFSTHLMDLVHIIEKAHGITGGGE